MQKPGEKDLTIRARARADLEGLRRQYFPEMGPNRTGEGTDYRYRASASHATFAEAVHRTVVDIDYANFKNMVSAEQGSDRAHIYSRVWDALWALQDEHA